MLHSTFELITLAASNSLVVFCFCNLIIVILLVASSKPSSEVDDEEKHSTQSLPSIAHRDQENSLCLDNNAGSPETTEALLQKNAAAPVEEVIETSTVNITVVAANDCQESRQDEEDDELRRKVEEFIEKVNRGWKEEKLRTYTFVH